MTSQPPSLREAEVKKLAAILRRVNWPLDGHGRYGSLPASQVNDAASRLYSAGVRAALAATEPAPERECPDCTEPPVLDVGRLAQAEHNVSSVTHWKSCAGPEIHHGRAAVIAREYARLSPASEEAGSG